MTTSSKREPSPYDEQITQTLDDLATACNLLAGMGMDQVAQSTRQAIRDQFPWCEDLMSEDLRSQVVNGFQDIKPDQPHL